MDFSGHHDMHGMESIPPSPPPPHASSSPHHRMMMMHMTFYWGKNAEILFDRWPGTRTGMYVLALVFVFLLAFLAEWLSHCRIIKPGPNRHLVSGLLQTLLYAVRTGIVYMVMLAVMSFNVGVFLVAVCGFSLGFFLFGSCVFNKSNGGRGSDLPPMSC